MPRTYSAFGDRAFSVSVPRAWNNLPPYIKHISSTDVFSKNLKSFLFSRAFWIMFLICLLCFMFLFSLVRHHCYVLFHLRCLNLDLVDWLIDLSATGTCRSATLQCGVVSNISQCQITRIAPLHVRDCAKSRAPLFIYLIFIYSVKVRVSSRVRVRFNNSHMSRKSRTASYLAMRHIWHDNLSFQCESSELRL